jgi:hypothetical protein
MILVSNTCDFNNTPKIQPISMSTISTYTFMHALFVKISSILLAHGYLCWTYEYREMEGSSPMATDD